MPSRLPPRKPLGPEALAALAVPARYAILSHLLAAGPRTASQCAEVVGESPSNCSWHLRALAKAGLVERVEGAEDGRTRPWRATAVGFTEDDDPAGAVAADALAQVSAAHDDALYGRYLAARPHLPKAWMRAGAANDYTLALTPTELDALAEQLDALIRPYVRPIRQDAPDDAQAVHLTLRAFLDPDLA